MVCFAVKANPCVGVLASLNAQGAGADVVSEGEIRAALAAGIPGERIVFSGVGKTKTEMAFALEQGIYQFNIESEPELRALQEVAASKNMRAPIAIRINPDVNAGTHAKISTGQKENKFGVSMEQAPALYALAATLPHVHVQGVSVHIGSQLTSLEPFAAAFKHVRSFTGQLRASGHTIRVLDLGGGLGIPYTQETPPPPVRYAATVKRELGDLGCRFLFEPGRLIAGNAGILVTKVIYVKHTPGRTFVVIDAGMNDLIRPAMYEAYHSILPVIEPPENSVPEPVDIVGPVCESSDIFAAQHPLVAPKENSLLVIRSAGAYGASMASTYNHRPLLAEVMVNGAAHAVIRPRQTYAELLARDTLPPWL